MQQTDGELVQRVLAGDTPSFGDLVRRYQSAVYGLAYSRVGSFDDAQDIAQETFLKAYGNLRQLDQPERFAAWLKAITLNECRMLLRQRCRLRATAEALSHAQVGAADLWQRDELRVAVLQALEALPETGRRILMLHYLAGFSCQEIAGFLDIPEQAVESRLYRARRRLKEEMLMMVEATLTSHKLPEDFSDRVLRELSLTPDGSITTVNIDRDRRTLILGAARGGKAAAMVALTMYASDQAAILSGPFEAAEALPKGRGIECALQILQAFGIALKQVVLHLEGETQCRAWTVLQKGRALRTLDLRASDGLALAARLQAPIYAEEAVIRQGKVGEDGLDSDVEGSLEALREELAACSQCNELLGKLFDLGLSPEAGRDTGRYYRDEGAKTLQIAVEGNSGGPMVLNLDAYRIGADKLWQVAGSQETGELCHNDRLYRTRYKAHGDEIKVHFVPRTAIVTMNGFS